MQSILKVRRGGGDGVVGWTHLTSHPHPAAMHIRIKAYKLETGIANVNVNSKIHLTGSAAFKINPLKDNPWCAFIFPLLSTVSL